MIAIFDYGAGNLRSVQNTLGRTGLPVHADPRRGGLARGDKILLPGVGHFGQMMRALDTLAVRETLIERIRAGIPFFGICLGMQALFETSEEAPEVRGLGIYPGPGPPFSHRSPGPAYGLERTCPRARFQADPQSSGAALRVLRPLLLRSGRTERASATCNYELTYTAALESGNVYGVQFHPEKSGRGGSGDRQELPGPAMLAKRIIPCLDVTGGRVVKGVNFVNLRDAGDPVELADALQPRRSRRTGVPGYHGLSDAREIMADVVARTARQVFIPLAVGGGIRSVADARRILLSGADKVSVNTAAVRRPELITELSQEFGAQAVVLAIDARRHAPGEWHVYTRGGRDDEGIDAVAWAARGEELGAGEILLTSMDTDGVQDGFDCALTTAVSRATHIPIIASGGAGKPEDFVRVLTEGCADAALAASIFHFGTYTVNQLKEELDRRGIPVRVAA